MIDASKGFKKDGPKNRLREQDIHKIVDTFNRQDESDPRYARMVPVAEIADPKNDYNLNLPRYIDSTEPEDLQDIDGHLRGGIPERDLDALGHYWKIMPALRDALSTPLRDGYSAIQPAQAEIKSAIFVHPEFTAFTTKARKLFTKWQKASVPLLKGLVKDGHPKPLIETIAEDLLATFKNAPLLDAYDVYKHLMDYWSETMQDDCYLVAGAGWIDAAQPRRMVEARGAKSNEKPDLIVGRIKYRTELVTPQILIARYFKSEQSAIEKLEAETATIEQAMEEMAEENGGEEGLLEEAKTDAGKLTRASVAARLREIHKDSEAADERKVLHEYLALIEKEAASKTASKTAAEKLSQKVLDKYPTLTEAEIQALVVDDKWLATLAAAVQGELDRVSQTLTGRIRQLAERYATPLPQLVDEVAALAARVDQHLKKMGVKL